ncbi:hypothetical protein UAJ10_13950 [Nitrospirillum sp. BR 11164]|uniref:hypothetical protein n=1 Tax=Nitrospirillum sp. BR 11164 TaxID=3104324 RepID=UPI002AFFFEEA|nr:hypothetical protein [Nitrospirillum sp. BR 11164]MEA1650109.1 hypothetical protein [Nitrospirillum sp. BR 11164]
MAEEEGSTRLSTAEMDALPNSVMQSLPPQPAGAEIQIPLWRSTGFRAITLLILAPILAKLGLILGWRLADPRFIEGWLASGVVRDGLSTLDPNIAYTSHALGHRAALDWLSGHIPWWNPYSGIGMPLAGDMQSAALFPPTLLLALPNGQLYMHISLQITAGVFTWLLMRRLGVAMLGATVASLLFEFNGTFAWLANAVINPIPFLPMVLLGVEEARARALAGRPGQWAGGWGWIAGGLALSLYAGFPEVAYFNGLLIALWTLARLAGLRDRSMAYMARVAAGTVAGLLLAAPILIAFVDYLGHGYLGNHATGSFRQSHLDIQRMLTLFLPYALGELGHTLDAQAFIFWGAVGGYTGLVLVVAAAMAVWRPWLRGLRLTLAGWCVVVTGAVYGQHAMVAVVTAIPAVGDAMFFRYFNPSISFALAVLAGLACHDLAEHPAERRSKLAYWGGLAAGVACLVAPLWLSRRLYVDAPFVPILARSLLYAVVALAGIRELGGSTFSNRTRAWILGAAAVAEAVVLFVLPLRHYPESGRLQTAGVEFLQRNLGLQRFYTLGPIQPNYSAYYGIAGINHNDLPLPAAWVDHVFNHLDNNTIESAFDGHDRKVAEGPTATENLRANLDAYRALGVKYLVAPTGQSPFDWKPPGAAVSMTEVLRLEDGGSASLVLPPDPSMADREVRSVGVLVATYVGQSRGTLVVRFCAADRCAEGRRDLATAADNQYLSVPLDTPVPWSGPAAITVRKVGGDFPVGLWTTPAPARDPQVTLRFAPPVAGDEVMDIVELPGARPYFTADGCQLTPDSREAVTADCPAPAALTRLELFMPGWTATLNGATATVGQDGPLFQKVDLPAGRSDVRFHYRPPHMGWGYAAFLVGLGLAAASALPFARNRRSAATP